MVAEMQMNQTHEDPAHAIRELRRLISWRPTQRTVGMASDIDLPVFGDSASNLAHYLSSGTTSRDLAA